MKLTTQEYNFLQDLSARTKMDCWFTLETDENGNDIVYDLENNEYIPLYEGIDQLFDGVLDDEIKPEEIEIFNALVCKITEVIK